jgi:uncharacterized protein (TIGR02284 family)
MQTNELIEMLQELVQVDIDTVHSYNRVLDEVTDKVMRSRLAEFRDHHHEHIDALAEVIRELGGKAPESSKDFKGHVIEAFAALRTTAGGVKNALKALRTTEEITNRYYGRAVTQEVPDAVKDLLRKHVSDEKIHIDYINENLKALGQ